MTGPVKIPKITLTRAFPFKFENMSCDALIRQLHSRINAYSREEVSNIKIKGNLIFYGTQIETQEEYIERIEKSEKETRRALFLELQKEFDPVPFKQEKVCNDCGSSKVVLLNNPYSAIQEEPNKIMLCGDCFVSRNTKFLNIKEDKND